MKKAPRITTQVSELRPSSSEKVNKFTIWLTDKNAEPKTEPQKEDLLEKGQRKRSQQRKETYFSAKQKAHYKKMREYEKKKRKTVPVAGTGTSKMKWREGQILGHGSFGTVLWGFDERKNIQMAVKKVYLGGTSDVSEVSCRVFLWLNFFVLKIHFF